MNPPPEEKAPETIVAVPVEPKVEVTSDNKPQETSVQVSDENLDKKEGLEVSVTKPEESGDAADGAKGLCISLLAICVSIPALIGA